MQRAAGLIGPAEVALNADHALEARDDELHEIAGVGRVDHIPARGPLGSRAVAAEEH
jgi:hypothetical protein